MLSSLYPTFHRVDNALFDDNLLRLLLVLSFYKKRGGTQKWNKTSQHSSQSRAKHVFRAQNHRSPGNPQFS